MVAQLHTDTNAVSCTTTPIPMLELLAVSSLHSRITKASSSSGSREPTSANSLSQTRKETLSGRAHQSMQAQNWAPHLRARRAQPRALRRPQRKAVRRMSCCLCLGAAWPTPSIGCCCSKSFSLQARAKLRAGITECANCQWHWYVQARAISRYRAEQSLKRLVLMRASTDS